MSSLQLQYIESKLDTLQLDHFIYKTRRNTCRFLLNVIFKQYKDIIIYNNILQCFMSATSWFHAAIFFHYGMQEFYILYPFYILICDVNYRRPFLILSRLFLTEMSLMFTVRIKRRKKKWKVPLFHLQRRLRHLYTKVPFLSFSSHSPFFATAI